VEWPCESAPPSGIFISFANKLRLYGSSYFPFATGDTLTLECGTMKRPIAILRGLALKYSLIDSASCSLPVELDRERHTVIAQTAAGVIDVELNSDLNRT